MKNFFLRLLAVALTTTGLVWLWLNAPVLIVAGFDLNLTMIKWVSSLVPAPYGAMGEVALRGLGADRALIFAEGGLVVKFAFWFVARLFKRRVPNQDA